jgi:hypothetical protein
VNLHGIFRRAGEVYGIAPNPVAAVKRPGRVRQRRQLKSSEYLEPRQVHALIAAAEDDTDAAIFATAAFCGLRLGELLALRWRAVDFERSLIRVEASFTRNNEDTPKSGDGRDGPDGAGGRKRAQAPAQPPHFCWSPRTSSSSVAAARTSTRTRSAGASTTRSNAPASRACACTTCATPSARSWSAASTHGRCSTGWATAASR